MLSWFTTPTTSFNVFHRCCPWHRIITNEAPWDHHLDYLPKEKKIMGKLGFFVVATLRRSSEKMGVEKSVRTLPGTGRLQEQTWDKVRMTIRKQSRTVSTGLVSLQRLALLGGFQGAVLTMSESSDFQLTSFLLQSEMLASRLHFL